MCTIITEVIDFNKLPVLAGAIQRYFTDVCNNLILSLNGIHSYTTTVNTHTHTHTHIYIYIYIYTHIYIYVYIYIYIYIYIYTHTHIYIYIYIYIYFRWYDKCFTGVTFSDAMTGMNVEHSVIDASVSNLWYL